MERGRVASNQELLSGRGRGEDGSYDRMQVCLNGHRVTSAAEDFPQFRKDFCSECGVKTITSCPECNAPIPGHLRGSMSFHEPPVPNNCHACGTAYPWRQDALAAAIEAAQLELDVTDALEASALVKVISTDNPRTEIAALKLRRLLSKMSKPTYDVVIKVIGDVAAATAKSNLGL